MPKPGKNTLPELNAEQARALVAWLVANRNDDDVDYDNICCGEDGVDEGYRAAVRVLAKAYGVRDE